MLCYVSPMTQDIFFALMGFCAAGLFTPGPNNMMLMTSGANFGLRRTLPHMFGVGIGFVVMIVLVGFGVSRLFDAFPATYDILKLVGVIYLLWLAWKIANAAPPKGAAHEGKPMTFLQAAAFQWVNPKAWTMALTATTLYAPDRSLWAIGLMAAVFGAVNLPSISAWTILGLQMRRVLNSTARLRAFNWTMALLLVASLIPVLFL